MTKFVNRLFLIGNGFDLALGLKTSYSDFLLWLLKKEVIRANESGVYKAPLLKYPGAWNKFYNEYEIMEVLGYAENELFDVLIEYRGYVDDRINEILTLTEFFEYIKKCSIKIIPSKSNLLTIKIIETSKTNWVDIEGIYFLLLKDIIKSHHTKNNVQLSIEDINRELKILSNYLKEYLSEQKIIISKEDALAYLDHFNKPIDKDDFIDFKQHEELVFPNQSYFLNFNYTDSLSQVLAHFPNFEFTQNFIHGSLIDDDIIFGFGDEMDSIYKEMEELNDNRFFEHIKSFHYFKTNKQRQLQTFLNSGDYQVCVYGHSCGLSDRVMLNEIFEHINCKSILIYYYNDEDFRTKTMEISRHFNDKQIMRKKIVEKRADCLIPQIEQVQQKR